MRASNYFFGTMILLVVSIGLLTAVNDSKPHPAPSPNEFHAFGTVRNVWDKPYASEIVFEHDNGVSQLFVFEDRVPVWAGEHVELVYKHGPHPSSHDECLYVRRLP